jgi:hypothetical protein
MRLRNEQIEAMGAALGLDFGARLAGCLKQLPPPGVENAAAVIDFCLSASRIYHLESEREIAVLALALSAKRGGGRKAVPLDAQSILRDLRMDTAERLNRLIEWAGDSAGTVASLAAPFEDKPAAGPIAKKEEAAGVRSITIQLIDEADWGVAGEEYRVEFSNGVRAHGYLDGDGEAAIGGIEDPGVCQISFPDLDQAVWERVS